MDVNLVLMSANPVLVGVNLVLMGVNPVLMRTSDFNVSFFKLSDKSSSVPFITAPLGDTAFQLPRQVPACPGTLCACRARANAWEQREGTSSSV